MKLKSPELTIGQHAVLEAWVGDTRPVSEYDEHRHTLVTTEEIHDEIRGGADFELTEIADYMSWKGFIYYMDDYGTHGWVINYSVSEE